MKAVLAPMYFTSGKRDEMAERLEQVKALLADEADFLDPVEITRPVPPEADGVVLVQLIGEAFSRVEAIRHIDVPLLVLTSEFATMAMWDWELVSILRDAGARIMAPYDLKQAKAVCKALALKRQMQDSVFVMYQDDPGEGYQADIFKRFYWWENACIDRFEEKFGITVELRSLKDLGKRARALPDSEVADLNNERIPVL